jgi:phenylacetate-coenzyme A ligase PaaK-like adenylate-forming protein
VHRRADGRRRNPVSIGERAAKVYLTNLYDLTTPLIRYELTDEVTVLGEPCPGGTTLSG